MCVKRAVSNPTPNNQQEEPTCKREYAINAETPTTPTALPNSTAKPAVSYAERHSAK